MVFVGNSKTDAQIVKKANKYNRKELRRTIEELPPSAKLVLKVLEYSGYLTQKEIAEESYLPPRTVRYALNRLKDERFLQERFYFKDARQSQYGLKHLSDRHETNEMPVQDSVNVSFTGAFAEKYELPVN
ncbi:MarR family transcriptional regulator [Methanohalophilus sp. RSK]|uniref:MarR family transcriptional regulator n=1 Tax=Methanohalophilus sp. RSK TaxID=2485783 RepID=UPI003519EC04